MGITGYFLVENLRVGLAHSGFSAVVWGQVLKRHGAEEYNAVICCPICTELSPSEPVVLMALNHTTATAACDELKNIVEQHMREQNSC
jgi:hypothetical protein